MISTHLTFAGECEAAFHYYERIFRGKRLTIFRYGDSPAAADVPEDFRDKLVHASLTIDDFTLAGADVVPAKYERPRGFYILYTAASHADAERIFAALADGGAIHMPLSQTFWAPAFGVVVDRFGTPWEITATAA